MSALKYKSGDKVRINDIDWYNKNKDSNGNVVVLDKVPHFSWYENVRTVFTKDMAKFCGKVVTIESVWSVNYSIVEGTYRDGINIDYFTDEMIEGLVEDENKPLTYEETVEIIEAMQGIGDSWECPQGYQFVDENGNVINTQKIILEKKKKEYPKIYEECCKIMQVARPFMWFNYSEVNSISQGGDEYERHMENTLCVLRRLLICRDAYWKIAGDEMGLGKPWEPSDAKDKYIIRRAGDTIVKGYNISCVLEFPTPEMRDAFYENFKEEIEICKELL